MQDQDEEVKALDDGMVAAEEIAEPIDEFGEEDLGEGD